MKGTLQVFVDDFFSSVLSADLAVPPAVKYFFDFLDEQAHRHDNVDEETLHIWKTNSCRRCAAVPALASAQCPHGQRPENWDSVRLNPPPLVVNMSSSRRDDEPELSIAPLLLVQGTSGDPTAGPLPPGKRPARGRAHLLGSEYLLASGRPNAVVRNRYAFYFSGLFTGTWKLLKNPDSSSSVHVTEDSPSNKLLYAKEISTYKKMVDDYYKGIRQMVPVSDQDMNTHLAEVSRQHTDKLNTQVALHQLYQYASKYYDGIIQSLDEDPAAQSKQLTLRLQQIAAALENKVTDL
ncbi:unnamed protein product [Boreogadus saida]